MKFTSPVIKDKHSLDSPHGIFSKSRGNCSPVREKSKNFLFIFFSQEEMWITTPQTHRKSFDWLLQKSFTSTSSGWRITVLIITKLSSRVGSSSLRCCYSCLYSLESVCHLYVCSRPPVVEVLAACSVDSSEWYVTQVSRTLQVGCRCQQMFIIILIEVLWLTHKAVQFPQVTDGGACSTSAISKRQCRDQSQELQFSSSTVFHFHQTEEWRTWRGGRVVLSHFYHATLHQADKWKPSRVCVSVCVSRTLAALYFDLLTSPPLLSSPQGATMRQPSRQDRIPRGWGAARPPPPLRWDSAARRRNEVNVSGGGLTQPH